jgi:hypothetical protein
MILASPLLVFLSLLAIVWGAWYARRAADRTSRRSGGAGTWGRMADEPEYDWRDDGAYRLDVKR